MNWQPGRQGSGYRKRLLAHGRRWDLYLIDYPPGSYVPTHTDRVHGGRHFRANLRLLGEDNFRGKALFRLGRLVVFRPDLVPHSVEPVRRRRLMLSFGIVR